MHYNQIRVNLPQRSSNYAVLVTDKLYKNTLRRECILHHSIVVLVVFLHHPGRFVIPNDHESTFVNTTHKMKRQTFTNQTSTKCTDMLLQMYVYRD